MPKTEKTNQVQLSDMGVIFPHTFASSAIVYRQWAVYIVCSNLSSAVYRYFDMSVKSAVYVCSSTHILIMQFNALIFADTVVSTVLSMTTNINIKLLRTCF